MEPKPSTIPASLETWWHELGLVNTLVVDLAQSLDHQTLSTLAGQREIVRPPSIEVQELPATPLRSGPLTQDLDDIEVEEEIGAGAMGIVHAARQHSLNRQIALKRLKPVTNPSAVAALINEARLTGRLEHPNIPPVHALCRQGDRPVLMMKRIQGEVWADLMDDMEHPAWLRTRWDDEPLLSRHVGVAEIVCDALQFAHSRGIVHRDIKPANVMIGEFGEVYLLDWGMAGRFADLNQLGPVVGTPAFMAPEMVHGKADPRTDVYLMGASLYRAVVGRPPHAGTDLYDCLAQIHKATAPTFEPSVPTDLAAIVTKAMDPDPNRRFQDVREFQRALRTWRSRRGVRELIARSLDRLHEAHDVAPEASGRLLSEARFGLLQARRAWDSESVRAGLADASLRLARWELNHGDLQAADRYIAELDDIPDALAEQVASLKAERLRRRELQGQAEQLDPDVSVRERTRYLALIAALMVGLALVVSWAASVGGSFGYRMAIWGSGNAALLTAMAMVLKRRQLFANDYNRRIVLLVILASAGIFGSRVLMMLLAVPMAHALVADLILLAGISGAAAITVRPWTASLSALCALAAIGCALLPTMIPWIVGGTALTAAVLSAFFLRR